MHLEVLKYINLFYLSPRAFVKLNLDNGLVYKKIKNMFYLLSFRCIMLSQSGRNTPMNFT
jgi:hypothetical protein